MCWQQQHSVWGTLSIIPQRAPYVALTHLPLSAHAFLWIFLPFFLLMPSPQQHLWKICSSCLLSPHVNPNLCFHFRLSLPDSVRASEMSQHWSTPHSPTASTQNGPEWDPKGTSVRAQIMCNWLTSRGKNLATGAGSDQQVEGGSNNSKCWVTNEYC